MRFSDFKTTIRVCLSGVVFCAFAANAQTALRDDFDSLSLDENTDGGENWVGRWIQWNVNALAGNSDDYFKMWDSLSYNNGPTPAEALNAAGYGNGPFLHEASGGTLKLRAYPAPGDLQSSIWDYPYVGSMISTEQSLSMNEGFIEVRYRNKTIDKGTHVSLWLLDVSGDYPPEIDIFETLSEDVNGSRYFFAYNAHGAPSGPTFTAGDLFGSQNFEFMSEREFTSWQTFRFEWNEDELIWARNKNVVRRQANYLGNRQMYFLLTMEGANVWTGDPDSSTRWPQEAEVDYVVIGNEISLTPALGVDEVAIQSAPDTIDATGSYTVSIAYNVDQRRDIAVNLLSTGPWENFGSSTVPVNPGSGVQTIEVAVNGPLPDRNYVWKAALLPEGGSWEEALFEEFADVAVDDTIPGPSVCSPPTGIKYQFRGEDGVDSWPGSLNFPNPEPAHTRATITSPASLVPYGTASMKTEIRPGDPQWINDSATGSPKRRAEYSWNDWRFDYGKEAWAGAAFYLPSDPMLRNKGTSFFQLHNYPDAGVMLHVTTWDGQLRISSDVFGGEILRTDLGPYLDTWTRIVINFKPTTANDGFLRVWLDDTLVVDEEGRTKTSGSQGPYFKHGAYYWGYETWDPVRRAVVYHDNLRIADETGSYESVDPKCW